MVLRRTEKKIVKCGHTCFDYVQKKRHFCHVNFNFSQFFSEPPDQFSQEPAWPYIIDERRKGEWEFLEGF